MASVNERLDKIESNQLDTMNILQELKIGVCGSEKIGAKGVIHRLAKVEKYIENNKKQKWMLAGALAVITFLAKILKII